MPVIEESPMASSKELLDILACPKCKGDIYLIEYIKTSGFHGV